MTTDADRQAREDDREERIDQRRRDSMWLAAQARNAGTSIASPILRATDLPDAPPPNRSAFIATAEPSTGREFAAHYLRMARVQRVGVEVMGAHEPAWLTLHEATRMASYAFASAYLAGSALQVLYLAAFIELHDRTERAKAALAAEEVAA